MNSSAPSRGSASAYRLRPSGSGEAGFLVQRGQRITVGRDPINPLQIGHASIAGFHCRMEFRDDGLFVAPVGDQRVMWGGRQIEGAVRIGLGDRVRLGQIELEVIGAQAASRKPDSLTAAIRREATPSAISIAVHLLIYFALQNWAWMDRREEETVAIRSDHVLALPNLLEDEEPSPEPESDEPPVLLEPEPEMPVPDPLDDAPPLFDPVEFDQSLDFATGAGASGRGGASGLRGGRDLRLGGLASGSGGLVDELKKIRATGMDVVFLVDTTSSMDQFLASAKRTIDHIVTQLAAMVGDLAIGLIAFRDHGDEYVTHHLNLSQDRYEILNFLLDLESAGGGDIPEAVVDAFEVAARDIQWRKGTRRVVLLVGDAPPHEEDAAELRSLIDRFRTRSSKQGSEASVTAIFTGATNGAREAAEAFSQIARRGKGDYLALSNLKEIDRRILAAAIGRRHESELDQILARVGSGPQERLIAGKLRDRDAAWLLGKMVKTPVHPDVVNALYELEDREVLKRLRDVVVDHRFPLQVRRAARYVLRRTLGRQVRIDPLLSHRDQRRQLRELDALIMRY